MADNVLLNAGTGGDTVAADDIGPGVKYQRVKVTLGADGVNDGDVASGNPMPVSGTVTANAGTNLNTSTLALESGGNLAAILADTANIETAVQLIDDTVATLGTATYTEATTKGLVVGAVRRDADTTAVNTDNEVAPLQVDANGRLKVEIFDGGDSHTVDGTVTANLAAGTNNIGDVDILTIAAGDNNIGNVDIVTMPAVTNGGTFAVQESGSALTALQLIDDPVQVLGTDTYTEAASKGVTIGAVRRDADTTLVNTTNEFGPLQMDANGRLKVEAFSGETLPVSFTGSTDAATQTTLASALTSLQLIDDAIYASDAALSKSMAVGAVFDDVATVAITENQAGYLRMSSRRALLVEGVVSGTAQPVSGTVTANAGTGPFPVSDNAGSLTVDAPIGTPVNVQIGNATLAAGVIDETGAAAVDALAVGGGTAHDAVDSGNPVKIGGVAVSGSATPTSVASGDRTRFISNQHGIPYSMSGHPNLITREFDFGTAAQTDLNLAAAVVAADERIYVTRFEAMCDNANTVAVSVRCGFGTASVPAASATGVSGMIASHPGIAAGSGIICGNGSGLIAVGGAGEEPRLTSSAATTGNLHVIISYYLIDETP